MQILRPESARAFLELARPLLASSPDAEARHNLMLGIAGTVTDHPDLYPTFLAWLAVEDGTPVAAASRTPPFNAILADPVTPGALEAVIDAVTRDDPETPGLVGNVPHVHHAAERWAERAGVRTEVAQRQGVYALTEVLDVPGAGGGARRAVEADRGLLLDWLVAFVEEATLGPSRDPGHVERMLDARIGADDAGYWLWEEGGRPVSLAGYMGPTPGGIRVGPVYTPLEQRRRGYATALVAELSRWLLGRGHRACFLYTDLANPTSNAIYGKIGYRRVCDSAEIRFT
jgi:uncharacterized protein